MPGISHEAPLELIRGDRRLAAVLLRGLGVAIPAEAAATMASSDLTASVPTELLAARGLEVPAKVREQVLSCTNASQLETWADRAATAASVKEVFGS